MSVKTRSLFPVVTIGDVIGDVVDSVSQGEVDPFQFPLVTDQPEVNESVVRELKPMVVSRISQLMSLVDTCPCIFRKVGALLSIYSLMDQHIVELYCSQPAEWYKFVIAFYKQTHTFYRNLKFDRTVVKSKKDHTLITNFMYYAMNAESIFKAILIRNNYFETSGLLPKSFARVRPHSPTEPPPPLVRPHSPTEPPPPLVRPHSPTEPPPPLVRPHSPIEHPPPLVRPHSPTEPPPPLVRPHSPVAPPPPLVRHLLDQHLLARHPPTIKFYKLVFANKEIMASYTL